MKKQEIKSVQENYSSSDLRRLQAAYQRLNLAVKDQPWIAQGSVNVISPKSPGGNVTYTWTRKIRAKTVSVALSETQANAFRTAITANRRLEEALTHVREVSQTALVDSLPNVARRRINLPRKSQTKTVQEGA